MTAAYAVDGWQNLALAVTAAVATLVGLLFVAVSINLQRILQFPNLPSRAVQTLFLFGTPLATGIFLLVPSQPRWVLATELLGTAVVIGTVQLLVEIKSPRSEFESTLTWILGRVSPPILTSGSLAAAGATLAAQSGGGLYWIVPSVFAGIMFGLLNAWVLLVEIMR
jgi:modulator of FtsH protease